MYEDQYDKILADGLANIEKLASNEAFVSALHHGLENSGEDIDETRLLDACDKFVERYPNLAEVWV